MAGQTGLDRRQFLGAGAAALVYGKGHRALAQTMAVQTRGAVTYDERSVMIDGKRLLLTCGEVHYARSTRAMWPRLLQRSKDLGINTITSYVFWNVHEPTRGVYDFTGERDLGHFLDLCRQQGLAVFLRIGPYICAEWNFGGFPPYLRDEPGITTRTMNKPYTDRVEAFFTALSEVVKPRLKSNGGPIVLVQVENEYTNISKRYGEEGQEYLKWIVALADRLGFATVPSTMCEGGAQGAIETSNGFSISQERLTTVRKTHPGTPLLWTEIYPAWYKVWGGGNIAPGDGKAMAGGILDFVSRGGSGINYYPWHGGTNFGRNSMYLQTTSYDFSAPLDEFGNVTATGTYLGKLHAVLHDHTTLLLEGDRTEEMDGGKRTVTWKKDGEELRLVQDAPPAGPRQRGFPPMQAKSGRLLSATGEVLFDVDATRDAVTQSFVVAAWTPVPQRSAGLAWQTWDEPMPTARHETATTAVDPVEQLSLTKDSTDYCWYSATQHVADAGAQEIVIPYGADFFYLYVDGKLAASTKLPLSEDRGAITPDDPAHPRIIANPGSENGHKNGFRHTFTVADLASGDHRIDLLATALGMIKGDWQITSPMNFERKGIWQGVTVNGVALQNWTMRPGLVGEQQKRATRPAATTWHTAAAAGPESRPLRWYRTSAQVPTSLLTTQAVFRIDGSGLGKGMIWVNGHAVGRHWSVDARGSAGTPSQRYYHVPADWLKATNEIVIFEEQAMRPDAVVLQFRA